MKDGDAHVPARPSESPAASGQLSLSDAAAYLNLPTDTVAALVAGSFLRPVGHDAAGPVLSVRELRAFMVWNVEDPGDEELIDLSTGVEGQLAGQPDALLDALEGLLDEMAEQAYEIFATLFPEAREWSRADHERFVQQAKGRFEAILAVSRHGFDVDEALASDLQNVGAVAAWDGAPLPQLLVAMRISRDLLVQTAVDLAEEGGHRWGLGLSLLLTQVLPATDRLTDSLAKGYWSAVVRRQKEARARYEHVVEHASDGVYEVDLEGRIQYCNPQLGLILGRRRLDELEGSLLSEVMAPIGSGAVADALLRPAHGAEHVEVTIARPDGVRRVLHVRTVARMEGHGLVGFQGVVRDVTAAHDLGVEKDRLLGSLLGDLRLALVRLADLGAGLESEGGRLGPDRLRHVGTSVVGNVQHLSDLADRVAQASRMAAEVPLLTPRPVELAHVVRAALAGAGTDTEHVEVQVPAGLTVMADSEGLRRVVRGLVDQARSGAAVANEAPVRVEVEGVQGGELYVAVSHSGPGGNGAPSEVEGDVKGDEEQVLVRTLIEAMGGRVWHEAEPRGGSRFRFTVPVANRREGDGAIRL
ncbi:MAG: PAS domain-containing protein [Actinomycetota bacterium]|nr:PAS domain-containing protein [Actinomycetota bacterium]